MRKSIIVIVIAIGLIFSSCNTNNNKPNAGFPPLKERNEVLAKSPEWSRTKERVKELFDKIKLDSSDLKSKLLLAQIYMKEARITGDHPYYYPASIAIIDNVLTFDSNYFEAIALKASVLLSLHHFKEAKQVGLKGLSINPNNGFIYGVLVDANVELGDYEEAVKMSDKMQSTRPGLESYSRASYLREIYGKNEDAITAMKMAYQAGMPGTEEASWAGNTLCGLYENAGELEKAKELLEIILQQRPSYAFATNSLGRIELANKNYDKAISLFNTAINAMPEVSFYENLAKAYKAKGEIEKSNTTYKKVIEMLKEDAQSGHSVEMEMALIYAELKDMKNALKFAKIEYSRRPDNIDVNATLAWVYYLSGDFANAQKHILVANRTGKQNAVLLYKTAMIEKAAGNVAYSNNLRKKAMAINPKLDESLI